MAPQVTATCFQEAELAPLRVLVLPHAGGVSRALALEWGKSFHAAGLAVELWGVDWSWPMGDADTAHSLELVAAICAQLSSGFFGKPFVLVGHSLGALVALALAHLLEQRNFSTPRHVFFSGAAEPTSWSLYDEKSTLQDDVELLKLLEQWGGTDKELLAIPEQRQALLARLRADLKFHNGLVDWYRQGKKQINADVTVFGGLNDKSVPVDSLVQWKEVCASQKNEFDVKTFKGGHFYLTSAESQEAFANALITKLKAVTAITVAESRTLIDGLNAKTAPYPSEQCLHDMFKEAVKRTPDAIAVCYEGKTLTFREVDEQSERLADYLFHVGVRPNCISGIFMEHCIEFVIAYIAALTAGGAYMPLEVVYPPDLLERVMEESKPTIVLTKKKFRNRLPAWQQALELDDGWLENLSKRNIPVMPADRTRTHPDDLAYVVMSSGTTGVPKGICCPHRGAVHSYNWRLTHCPYKEDDRMACHVFFVWELLRPMLGNRPLYIIPDSTIYDPVKLVEYLDTHVITRILFTPSLLQLILDTCSREVLLQKLSKLRLVWLCGEVVTLELRDRFVRLFPKCELQNLYSVSECHDVSAVDLARMSDFDNSLSTKYASCGEVMDNVKAYVLDDNCKPVSVGVPGELYIGGPCLAIGYLNRPEQTAQRFLKHVVPGETVYRTGDRARFLPNGHLELIGRCDFMVKIRGYSVVLGAVESALAQHPLVSTSVVLTEGDEGEDKRLVAYIVPEDWEKVPSASNLRGFLKEKLPHYAIPSVFVHLDALPINSASGKLDRKKMPSIEEAKKLRNESIDLTVEPKNLPQTDTEKKLALIWADLLRLESDNVLHREASFFDVGGHSLLSTRLVSSVRDTFDVHLTLADILSSPELCAIAARIDQSLGGSGKSNSTSELTEGAKKVVLPLEAVLDASIYPAATRKTGYSRYRVEMVGRPPRNVFLTGATGFLGVHLLHALLKYTTSTVFCLVRAADVEVAMDRIKKALKEFGLSDEAQEFHLEDRVIPLPGNLSHPLLGLDADTFKMLATEIDAILHNGADVNLVKPYSTLKSANVLGTQEVLRLAVTNGLDKTRVKPVHYISTNGVFPSTLPASKFLETTDLSEISDQLENGYAQSKWVAEQMCHEAAHRGLPVSILRPGNMAPSSRTGQWNGSDFIYLLLKGCATLGSVPARSDWYFDMTPVDYAAHAIVHFAALHPVESLGQTLHIQNPLPPVKSDAFFQFFTTAMASSSTKKTLATVKYAEWKRALQEASTKENTPVDLQKLAAGIDSFEVYFQSDKVLQKIKPDETLPTSYSELKSPNGALLQNDDGSLRPVGGSVSAYSWENLGMLTHMMAIGVVYGTVSGVIYAVFNNYLHMSATLVATATALVTFPRALRLFTGLLTDCVPICALPLGEPYYGDPSLSDIATSDLTPEQLALINTDAPNRGIKLIILMMIANFGSVMAFSGFNGTLMDVSQREPESRRGTLLGDVTILHYAFTIVSSFMTGIGLNSEDYGGTFSWTMGFNAIMWVCAAASLLTIPFSWYCIQEVKGERVSTSVSTYLYNLFQERAIYRYVAFHFFYNVFSSITVTSASVIKSDWAKVEPLSSGIANMATALLTISGAFLVKKCGLHWNWRYIIIVCQVTVVCIDAIPTMLTIWDVYRNQWFWLGVPLVAEVPTAAAGYVAQLFMLEIENTKGFEATLLGLAVTTDAVGSPFATVITKSVDGYFDIERTFIEQDDHHVRLQVTYAYLIAYVFNIVSVGFVFLLPKQKAEHVKLATEAYRLGPAPASESYLNYHKILEICRLSGAQAVHPGYGFLSENAAFARSCQEANIEFIGPPVKAIEDMGSKSASKDIMIAAGVPVTPGYHGEDQSFDTLQKEARKIGYPVLIKAVLGGGGKGMRIVDQDKDLQEALDACPNMSEALRKKMGDAAVAAAKAVGYVGAGTVEFLLDEDESFYFMEMNTRLQVEHPVTEMITQQDLVELQLKVAAGQELPIRQEDLKIHGHAFEARIYAENPYNDFLPGSGKVQHLRLPPVSKDVRVDTGIVEGDEVSIFYDPMIAKLIVHGDNRQAALDKMVKALHQYQIVGLPTNIEFVSRTADHDAFREGGVDTSFLNKFGGDVLGSLGVYPMYATALGAVSLLLLEQLPRQSREGFSSELHSPWSDDSLAYFRSLETLERKLVLSHDDTEESVTVKCLSKNSYEVQLNHEDNTPTSLSVNGTVDDSGNFKYRVNNRTFKGTAVIHHENLHIFCDDNTQRYEYKFHVPLPSFEPAEGSAGATVHSKIMAPMPGKIIKVLVKNGDAITAEQPMLIMEAMKMEHVIRAPKNGSVREVFCEQDDFVTDGHVLVELD
ncbi:hypothetical protein JM18_004141 [Phytophthora kernoviae]|uniref:Carrier domain-containing protein n=1 Tax=Phytophthora kernoviae TaxID=325452 RepID=A0A8T0M206_9STRA|nr:hypothetical protein JM16_004399 [Phytophthora kernoviae]KAG2526817.1 hypothetical protein JM18_004141 [Phytophthora kernoviae]